MGDVSLQVFSNEAEETLDPPLVDAEIVLPDATGTADGQYTLCRGGIRIARRGPIVLEDTSYPRDGCSPPMLRGETKRDGVPLSEELLRRAGNGSLVRPKASGGPWDREERSERPGIRHRWDIEVWLGAVD